MNTLVRFGCATLVAGACGLVQAANDWYVDINSTAAEPDGKSWETAFRDVQSALDLARGHDWEAVGTWDRVHIKPGHYYLTSTLTNVVAEANNYKQCFCVYGVTDKALKNGNVPESELVILDGQNAVTCFEVSNARFFGITFLNGLRNVYSAKDAEIWGGAGLHVEGSAVVSNCVFKSCISGKFGDAVSKAHIYGGGAAFRSGGYVYETLFEDCGISNGCSAAVTTSYPANRYRGGGVYGANGALSGCIFRRNFIADPTKLWSAQKAGSAAFSVGSLTDNCLFESNYFATATANATETMGVEGTNHTFSNLVFRGNVASYVSCFRTGQGCVVTHCSFIKNRTTETGLGCLGSPLSTKGGPKENIIRNCLFLNNFAPNGTSDNSGVCIHTHFGDSSDYERQMTLQNCAFVGNVSDGGAGGQAGEACFSLWAGSRGAFLAISNCWFEANLNATNSTWCWPVVNVGSLSNYRIEDCMFKDNVTGKDGNGGYSGMIYGTGGDATYGPTTNSTIRNCAFINNKALNILSVYSPVTDATMPGLTIENCTLAGNRMTSTTPAIANLGNASYRTFIYNTALYDNKNGATGYNLGTAWADHVFTSYIGPQSAARTVFDKDGNIVSDDDPLFVDAAAGDYRLQKKSPLVDAGQSRGWIPTQLISRRKSPADLSGMTAVYDATGAVPGVQIVRTPKRMRRFSGEEPDIGAYEYPSPFGAVIQLK